MIREFDEWFNEVEGYGLRSERFHSDLLDELSGTSSDTYARNFSFRLMRGWLRAAFEAGYEAAARANATPPECSPYKNGDK
jgi:hypothetical protein